MHQERPPSSGVSVQFRVLSRLCGSVAQWCSWRWNKITTSVHILLGSLYFQQTVKAEAFFACGIQQSFTAANCLDFCFHGYHQTLSHCLHFWTHNSTGSIEFWSGFDSNWSNIHSNSSPAGESKAVAFQDDHKEIFHLFIRFLSGILTNGTSTTTCAAQVDFLTLQDKWCTVKANWSRSSHQVQNINHNSITTHVLKSVISPSLVTS